MKTLLHIIIALITACTLHAQYTNPQIIDGQYVILPLSIEINIKSQYGKAQAFVNNSNNSHGYAAGEMIADISKDHSGRYLFSFINKTGRQKITLIHLQFNNVNFLNEKGQVFLQKLSQTNHRLVANSQNSMQRSYFNNSQANNNNKPYQQPVVVASARSANFFDKPAAEKKKMKKKKNIGLFGKLVKGATDIVQTAGAIGNAGNAINTISNGGEFMNMASAIAGNPFNQNTINSGQISSSTNQYLDENTSKIIDKFIDITGSLDVITGGKNEQITDTNQRLKDIRSGEIYQPKEQANGASLTEGYMKAQADKFERDYGEILDAIFPERKKNRKK